MSAGPVLLPLRDEPRPRPGPPRPLVPGGVRRHLGWLTLLTAAWVAGWAATVWHTWWTPEPFRRIDHRLGHVHGWHHRLAEGLAGLGDANRFLPILAVVVLLCVAGRSWRAVVGAFASLGVVLLLVEVILKPLVDAHLTVWQPPSFPSGHTATAGCLATVAVLLLGRRHGPLRFPVPLFVRVIIVVLAIAVVPAVGLSMIALRAHSVVDVLGALPLGVVATLLTAAAVDRFTRPPGSRPVG